VGPAHVGHLRGERHRPTAVRVPLHILLGGGAGGPPSLSLHPAPLYLVSTTSLLKLFEFKYHCVIFIQVYILMFTLRIL
jgi:hypothetical protein